MSTPGEAPKTDVDRRPVVYGYLRAEEPDEIELAAQAKEIEWFCQERGYRLETVVIDRRATGAMAVRAGFTGLLDVLELDTSYGVVVPDLGHISDNHRALSLMQQRIQRTASKLFVIHEQADDVKTDGA